MNIKLLQFAVAIATLISIPKLNFAQAPDLGTVKNFVLFSSNGAVSNTGKSHLTGSVGANIGSVTNFGNVDGVMHYLDGATAVAAIDLLKAYHQLDTTTATAAHAALLGGGDTLVPGVYRINGATSFSDTLILDGKGQANAVFIFQIQGAFSSTVNA
jgi:hypothetical protein